MHTYTFLCVCVCVSTLPNPLSWLQSAQQAKPGCEALVSTESWHYVCRSVCVCVCVCARACTSSLWPCMSVNEALPCCDCKGKVCQRSKPCFISVPHFVSECVWVGESACAHTCTCLCFYVSSTSSVSRSRCWCLLPRSSHILALRRPVLP